MKCSECNNSLVENAKFCTECGAKVPPISNDRAAPFEPVAPQTKSAAMKQYATEVAREAGEQSKAALKSDLGKKMAAGAAIGAVAAIPMPFVGPAVGAVVGAGVVAFRRLTK